MTVHKDMHCTNLSSLIPSKETAIYHRKSIIKPMQQSVNTICRIRGDLDDDISSTNLCSVLIVHEQVGLIHFMDKDQYAVEQCSWCDVQKHCGL